MKGTHISKKSSAKKTREFESRPAYMIAKTLADIERMKTKWPSMLRYAIDFGTKQFQYDLDRVIWQTFRPYWPKAEVMGVPLP